MISAGDIHETGHTGGNTKAAERCPAALSLLQIALTTRPSAQGSSAHR